jgi:hypothetical protein
MKRTLRCLKVGIGTNQSHKKKRGKTARKLRVQDEEDKKNTLGEGIEGQGADQGSDVTGMTGTGIDLDLENAVTIRNTRDARRDQEVMNVAGGTTIIEAIDRGTLKRVANAGGPVPESEPRDRGADHPTIDTNSRGRNNQFWSVNVVLTLRHQSRVHSANGQRFPGINARSIHVLRIGHAWIGHHTILQIAAPHRRFP